MIPDGTVDARIDDCKAASADSAREVEDLPRSKVREAKQTGVTKRRNKVAGQQKVGKGTVKAVKPDKAFVLVCSHSDEMDKWARASYTFRGRKASVRTHLNDMDAQGLRPLAPKFSV